jgi:hypothetical protein
MSLCGLTFELTPTAEAGGVSPVTDDATDGGRRAYDACRSGSGAERGVRPHVNFSGCAETEVLRVDVDTCSPTIPCGSDVAP